MNTIIIGFSRARSIWKVGSTIIAASEKRDYSHVYIRYTDIVTGVELVCQASHGYVNEVSWEIFKEDNIIVEEYDLQTTAAQTHEILTYLKQNLGKPYSKLQLVVIAIKKLFRISLKLRDGDKTFICSELGAKVCKFKNIIINDDLDLETPSDLNFVLKAHNIKRL